MLMKTNFWVLAVCGLSAVAGGAEMNTARCWAIEMPYAFRTRLETVHEEGRRDPALHPAVDEFVFADGMKVDDADFADYLNTSMGVNVFVGRSGVVVATIDDTLRDCEYMVEVRKGGIEIRAADKRAIHQAYYHLEDLMNLRRAPFLKLGRERRRSLFSPRMVHSGWGLDIFPEAHLKQMAHAGIDAILIFLEDVNKTQGGGERAGVNDIIERALKCGIDTYLYSKMQGFVHPDDSEGAVVLRDSFGRVAAAHSEAKGIVFVGESCQFPSRDPRVQPVQHQNRDLKDPRPLAGWFPCKDYPDWLNAVKNALHTHAPRMEIVFWTYNWSRQPVEPCADLIRNFPDDVTILSTFGEGEEIVHRNGLINACRDYTISCPGPTQHFSAEATASRAKGCRLYAMANTGGLTWDFGVIPYQPCPYQWKRRWDALRESVREDGLCGLMESHHYGWYPSFISELAKEIFTEGGIPFDEHIRKIAARDFGEENVERVLAVWRRWSDAAADYVATNENQYGPFRIGPSYPFNFGGKPIEYSEYPQDSKATFPMRWMTYLNQPYDQHAADLLNIVYKMLPETDRKKEMELLESARTAYAEGAEDMRRMAATLDFRRRVDAERLAGIGEFMGHTVRTAINLRRGNAAFVKGDKAELLDVARDEYANAFAALQLVKADSRLGWEPTLEYVGSVEQIRWKLERMERIYGDAVHMR